MGAHRGSLKPYVKDVFAENPIKLYYHRRTVTDPEGAPDEYTLEKILGHEERDGRLFFRVKWEGWEDPTIEPAGNFFQKFNGPLIKYGLDHNIHLDIFKELEHVKSE